MCHHHPTFLRAAIVLILMGAWLPAGDILDVLAPPMAGIPDDIGTLALCVSRSGSGVGTVSVQVTTSDNSTVAGVDYIAVNTTLTWGDGDLAVKSVPITIIHDSTWRIARIFRVHLTNPTGGAMVGLSPVGIYINSQGSNPAGVLTMVVANANSSYCTVRADVGQVPVSVARIGQGVGALDAAILFQDQGATAGLDYQIPADTSLHWADGETGEKSVMVPILPHGGAHLQRSFAASIDFQNVTPGVLGRNTSMLFTIIDPAPPAAGVLVIPPWLQVRENDGTATVMIARAGGGSGTVTVDYTTSDGSATSPGDYTACNGTLTWLDGDNAPKPITIPIIDNAIPQWDLYCSLEFSHPTGGLFMPQYPSTSIAIVDDDGAAGRIGISSSQVMVANDQGTAAISFIRVGGTQGAVSADYATSDVTARSPYDFTAVSGTVTWADGDGAPKVITVPIVNHVLVNGPVAFTLDVTNLTGGADLYIGDWLVDGFNVIITDSHANSAGQCAFTQSTMRVTDDAGQMVLPVVRTGGTTGQVIVAWDLAPETAQMSRDYTGISGLLVWNDGESGVRNITVPVIPRAQPVGVRTFTASFIISGGRADGVPPWRMTCAIADREPVSPAHRPTGTVLPVGPGSLSFTADAITVDERAGNAVFTVKRSGGHAGAIAVTCSTLPSVLSAASPDIGHVPSMTTLTWTDGDETAKTFAVPILHDGLPGGDRSFRVVLSAPVGGALLDQSHGAPTAIATIIEGDTAPAGTLSFSALASACSESDGAVTLTINRGGGSAGTVSAMFMTAPITALEGVDFTTTTATTLVWPAGDAAPRTLRIPILHNPQVTGDRQFSVAMQRPTGGAVVAASPANITIHDQEVNPAGMLQWTAATIRVAADAGTVGIHVARSGGTAGAITVDYALSDGFAIYGTDYTAATNGMLSWPDGDNTDRIITVTLVDRGTTGKSRDLSATLTRATGGATMGQTVTAVTITDHATSSANDGNSGPGCGFGGLASLFILMMGFLVRRLRAD